MRFVPSGPVMTMSFVVVSLQAALASAAPAVPATTAPVHDVRDFFRKPDRSRFAIAPDGRHIAFLARRNGR